MKKICKNCGKEFIPKSKLAECCGEKCKSEWKIKYQRQYYDRVAKERGRKQRESLRKQKNSVSDLATKEAEARAAGMSYGKYMARMQYGMK